MLPADLRTAEAEALTALEAALATSANGRWTVEWRFEGLRLLPVVLRLAAALQPQHPNLRLLFPDAGAAALAKRDGPDLAGCIGSLGDQQRLQQQGPSQGLLLLVAPAQAEYEEVESVCGQHQGPVVIVNGALEDAAVGIGSVARQRRRGFLAQWQAAYALLPQAASALRHAHPGPWELYRLDPDGFRLAASFDNRPDAEAQEQALNGGAEPGLGANLRSLNSLIEGLQR